jgi:hypothetical protein
MQTHRLQVLLHNNPIQINKISLLFKKTEVSSLDPCIPATCSYVQNGNLGHQLVMALPPRTDGKVWVGVVTWSSSKPVEVLVFQEYNSSVTADADHGQPLTAPVDNGQMAISLIKTSSGTPIASGSYPSSGNWLAFHIFGEDKFIITYDICNSKGTVLVNSVIMIVAHTHYYR